MTGKVDGGDFYFLLLQNLRDLIRAVALHCEGEDPPHDLGGFFVHQPMCPAFIPKIAVKDGAGQVLAAHALCLEYGFDLLAGVPRIILVHNIAERGKIIVAVDAVYAVVNGDQANAFDTQNLHDLPDLEIVAPQAAHVLNDDCLHTASLDLLHHGGEAGAVKASAGDTIVGEMGRVWKTIPSGVVLQHLLLVGDGVAFALQLIVAGKPLIEGCYFRFQHTVVLLYEKCSKCPR